jgi:hypothetical protein
LSLKERLELLVIQETQETQVRLVRLVLHHQELHIPETHIHTVIPQFITLRILLQPLLLTLPRITLESILVRHFLLMELPTILQHHITIMLQETHFIILEVMVRQHMLALTRRLLITLQLLYVPLLQKPITQRITDQHLILQEILIPITTQETQVIMRQDYNLLIILATSTPIRHFTTITLPQLILVLRILMVQVTMQSIMVMRKVQEHQQLESIHLDTMPPIQVVLLEQGTQETLEMLVRLVQQAKLEQLLFLVNKLHHRFQHRPLLQI